MKKFIFPISICLVAFCFTSCLKSGSEYDKYSIQSVRSGSTNTNVVEIGLTRLDTSNFFSNALPALDHDTTVSLVPVILASPNGAPTDIHVKLTVSDSILQYYVDSINPSVVYKTPDSSKYTLLNGGVVTIPKGSNVGYLQIKLTTQDFISDTINALAFKIVSIDQSGYIISGNLYKGIVAIPIKNIYDGTYTSTGYLYHPSSPRSISLTKTLSTVDAHSILIDLGDLGGNGYKAVVTVNADNTLQIVAAAGAAGSPYTSFNTGLPTTAPGYTPKWSGSSQCNNTYDPTTKTFYLRYGYKGGTGWRVTEEIVKKK